jgi:hypothetical protein
MTFAHVMGIPLEESMLSLAPAAAAMLAAVGGWLRRQRARKDDRSAMF